jgi:hypothetical protein
MADNQVEEQEAIDQQKQYLQEKLGGLLDQVGDGYGTPLLEELIRRLDRTIAEFHEEVTELLVTLKKTSVERREKLRARWEHREEPASETKSEDGLEERTDEAPEMSDWEKRLIEKAKAREQKQAPAKTPEPAPKEKPKKGLFGRKK